jgi:hypothetical protein
VLEFRCVVVLVVVVACGAGIVVVVCSEEDVVRVVGVEPQPASSTVPAIAARPDIRRILLFIVLFPSN